MKFNHRIFTPQDIARIAARPKIAAEREYTNKEVCQLLNISLTTFRKLCKQGHFGKRFRTNLTGQDILDMLAKTELKP